MHLTKTLSLLFLVALLPVNALGETTLIDLDSAPGNYSTWRVSDLSTTSVQFSATFKTLQKHEQWVPSYSVKLSDSLGNELNLSGGFQGSEEPEATTTVLKDQKEIASLGPFLQLVLNRTSAVKMSWSGTIALIEVDGVRKSYDIGFTPTTIEVLCSTGELELKDIVFGK